MARLFVFLVAIVAVLALVEGGKGDRKGRRAVKKCTKNIKKFESCLKKGYKSKAGCISGDGELNKKDMKKCRRIEKRLKWLKCDYSCDKKVALPYDLNCKRVGFDFWGADIRSFSASSLEACAMACVNEPGCKSITTKNSDNYCWLKNKNSGQSGPENNAAVTSMNLECDRSAVDSSCKRDNYDFWGADLKNFISESFEDCASHCRDTADCQSFTLKKSDNYCWLKNKRGGQNGPSPNDALISMNIDCSTI